MKKLVLPSLLALLLPAVSYADIVVYKGSAVVKTSSADESSTRVVRRYEVVDLSLTSNNAVAISVSGTGANKTVTASDPVTFQISSVTDKRTKKTSTVLGHVASSSDATTAV